MYLSASFGATIQLHYCMGKYVSWEFGSQSADDCDNCGMHKKTEESNNCCSDITKKIESCKEHKQAESLSTSFSYSDIETPFSDISIQNLFLSTLEKKTLFHRHLKHSNECLLNLFCTYLI